MDLKLVFGGGQRYTTGVRARTEQSGAVAQRAAEVHGEYLTHARRIDRLHSPTGSTRVGQAVTALGTTRGLAVGQYTEASPDLHCLIAVIAENLAVQHWRELGAASVSVARAFFITEVRSTFAFAISREFARVRLAHIQYIGATRAEVEPTRAGRRMDGSPLGPAGGHTGMVLPVQAFMRHLAYGYARTAGDGA